MTGWFKIEGHSNPKHRTVFWAAKKRLTKSQKIAGAKAAAPGKEELVWQERTWMGKVLEYKGVLFSLMGIFLITIGSLLLAHLAKPYGNIGVVSHMETLQIQVTGSPEFISQEARSLASAEELVRHGEYRKAYALLFSIYRRSSFDIRTYDLLHEVSLQLCTTDPFFCEEAPKWKAIADRLRTHE